MARICSLPSILATSQSEVLLDQPTHPLSLFNKTKRKQVKKRKKLKLFACPATRLLLPSIFTIRQSEVLLDQQQEETLEVGKSRCNMQQQEELEQGSRGPGDRWGVGDQGAGCRGRT